jgi:hypothetical protein
VANKRVFPHSQEDLAGTTVLSVLRTGIIPTSSFRSGLSNMLGPTSAPLLLEPARCWATLLLVRAVRGRRVRRPALQGDSSGGAQGPTAGIMGVSGSVTYSVCANRS